MSSKSRETQIAELNGALEVLFDLREEFAQWAEEGEDESKREALENVLGHVEVMEAEYKRRRDELVG
ncbi:hypothetical protein [Microbaculum sp. FT89]|uniref:hypothetical protein n=1 Tax=Microbaculum sp. FT89 TaxID=3447298 RepID=UPI003F52C0D9